MHVKRAVEKGEIFMKTRTLLVILVALGLLASCVQMNPSRWI